MAGRYFVDTKGFAARVGSLSSVARYLEMELLHFTRVGVFRLRIGCMFSVPEPNALTLSSQCACKKAFDTQAIGLELLLRKL